MNRIIKITARSDHHHGNEACNWKHQNQLIRKTVEIGTTPTSHVQNEQCPNGAMKRLHLGWKLKIYEWKY